MWLESRAEKYLFGFLALGLILGFTVLSRSSDNPDCDEVYRRDIVVKADNVAINSELAHSKKQVEKGLSNKSCIGDRQGILFKFEKPGNYPFWMKDMKFSIDIIWINQDHKIVHIEKNISPSTFPKNFTNSDPAVDVLEIQAGESDQLGLKLGSQLYY